MINYIEKIEKEIESVIKSIPNVIQVAVLLSENQINHESVVRQVY